MNTDTVTRALHPSDPIPAATGQNPVGQPAAAIELEGISKRYGKTQAVRDLSLRINRGEIVAILGPNGAGKSTTIDIALGLVQADRGSAQLLGMTPRAALNRSLVGVVQQNDALLADFTVEKLMRIVAGTHPHARPVAQVLEVTGITHLAKRRVGKCSGGEKQRIRLAMALLSDPLLLILDEPTTGMDVRLRQEFWEFISHESQRGRTIVFATHYLAEAEAYAVRTVVISGGSVIADDPTEELRTRYAHYTLEAHCTQPFEQLQAALQSADPSWEITRTRTGNEAPYRVAVRGRDVDEAARIVLADPATHGLTVTKSSLEEAYLQLVSGENRGHLATAGSGAGEEGK